MSNATPEVLALVDAAQAVVNFNFSDPVHGGHDEALKAHNQLKRRLLMAIAAIDPETQCDAQVAAN